MAQPSKVILVFCDGTGLDGILGLESVPPESLAKSVTNVLHLSRTVAQYRAPQGAVPRIPQIVYYQPGLGSQAGFDPNSGMVSKLLSGELGEKYNQALGVFVASKIREVYTFIAQNYVAGDLICLFGFSRGAYTARKVAGLIDRIGILSGKDLYSFSEKLLDPKYRTQHPEVRIKFVGVWDTVGSVRTATGEILDAYSISDRTLPPNVDNAYHAVALQENQSNFLPTLWDELKAPNTRQVLEQVWFLGDHGDVGGGHQNVDLSDISLMWIAEKLSKFVDLDNAKLDYYINRPRAAGWGNSQPFNAFLGLPRPIRMPLFTTEKRDALWNARKDVLVHTSCDKAADPISRGYQVLRPVKDLTGFKARKRANFGGIEKRLSDSTRWAAANLNPKLVRQPDTSQDATAISFDETKRAGKDILSGDILGGGARLAGGAIGTGLNFVGEMFR